MRKRLQFISEKELSAKANYGGNPLFKKAILEFIKEDGKRIRDSFINTTAQDLLALCKRDQANECHILVSREFTLDHSQSVERQEKPSGFRVTKNYLYDNRFSDKLLVQFQIKEFCKQSPETFTLTKLNGISLARAYEVFDQKTHEYSKKSDSAVEFFCVYSEQDKNLRYAS